MKVLIVGGSGTVGVAVAKALKDKNEVITAGFNRGDVRVDVLNNTSIIKMYESVSPIDAVVITTGKLHFAALSDMRPEDYYIGLNDKLMGQVNLVLAGLKYINDRGSFTLTSGILSCDPIRYGSSASMVNGAIDGFVRGAAIEMPRGIRINVVSPTVLSESMDKYSDYFRGYEPVPAEKVALNYVKSVEGLQTGQVYKAGYA